MDDAAVGAVSAVWHSDTSRAEQWFDLISSVYRALVAESDDAAQDWSRFTQSLRDKASAASFESATVDGFVTYVESVSSEPMSVIAQLADPSERDAVLRTYADALTAAYAAENSATDGVTDEEDGDGATEEAVGDDQEEVAAEGAAAFDQQVWLDYLARWNGQWDGRDDSWGEFVAGLTYYAPPGCEDLAAQVAAYLAGQQDRAAALAVYGIEVAKRVTPAPVEPAEQEPIAEADDPDEVVVEIPQVVENEIVEKVFEPAMKQLFDNVDALADQLGMTPDELRAQIDGLPPEFFAGVITEAVTEPA